MDFYSKAHISVICLIGAILLKKICLTKVKSLKKKKKRNTLNLQNQNHISSHLLLSRDRGKLTPHRISETLQSPRSLSWQFPESEGPSQNMMIVVWVQRASPWLSWWERGLRRVFPHFAVLLSSMETCSSVAAHRACGQPDVLTGKLWNGQ